MGKKTSVASSNPDPAIGQAALMNARLGEQQLEFAERAYTEGRERQKPLDEMSLRIQQSALDTQEQATRWAREDRSRWEENFLPMQDRFIREAQDFDSRGRQEARAGEARGDILSNAAMQRQATQRQQTAIGVDPRSGRYAGIDRAGEVATALGAAGAENAARNQVRAQGMALRADAINLGNGLPAQAASGATLGLSAGGSAMGTGIAANQNWMANNGQMAGGYAGAMQGYSNQAGILNQSWQTSNQAVAMNNEAAASSAAGWGQAAGAAAGIAMMFM